jgi:hypothetical protein
MPVPTHTSSMIHGGSSTGSLRFAERKSRATRISASDKTSNISPILRPRWIHMGNPWNPWNLGGTGAIWTSVFVIHIPGPQQWLRSSRKEKMSIINLEELWIKLWSFTYSTNYRKKSISQKPCYHGFHTRIAGTYIDPSWSLSCWKSQRLISTLWDLVFLPVNHPDMFVGLMSILDLLPTCVA